MACRSLHWFYHFLSIPLFGFGRVLEQIVCNYKSRKIWHQLKTISLRLHLYSIKPYKNVCLFLFLVCQSLETVLMNFRYDFHRIFSERKLRKVAIIFSITMLRCSYCLIYNNSHAERIKQCFIYIFWKMKLASKINNMTQTFYLICHPQ